MSRFAEFARELHENEKHIFPRKLEPVSYPSKSEKLGDIRAVICDVYGTLINYWKPGFETSESRTNSLLKAFRIIADRFGITEILIEINPQENPEKTLSDFYHGLIALNHEKARKAGKEFPEVKIEEVWSVILLILKRRGYDPSAFNPVEGEDFSRVLAFTYNFYSLGRQLYPGVVDALEQLKKQNMVLGIVSNAQFYTPMDLTLLIRDQSNGKYDDFNELFDPDLTFFSYEYGVAKPNQLLYRRLFDSLYEFQILPEQTVIVGNDLSIDIEPSAGVGMRTAFFTGDKESAFMHDLDQKVIPDLCFQSWDSLPQLLSFFSKEKNN
ncbi:MAG TPA: HAD family hydrolase [Chitinispirillaceae bacterium]|nr:HAD family hydrolase [Chitinispirillaceae bacterium]